MMRCMIERMKFDLPGEVRRHFQRLGREVAFNLHSIRCLGWVVAFNPIDKGHASFTGKRFDSIQIIGRNCYRGSLLVLKG